MLYWKIHRKIHLEYGKINNAEIPFPFYLLIYRVINKIKDLNSLFNSVIT